MDNEPPTLSFASVQARPCQGANHKLPVVTWNELEPNTHHVGKAFYAVIKSVTVSNGMLMTVEDSEGTLGKIWSLIAFPFPSDESAASEGAVVVVKWPVLMMSPSGYRAVCVHHPTDIVRISKFDVSALAAFPIPSTSTTPDLLEAGNTALLDGRQMDANDYYSECIGRTRHSWDANQGSSKELDDVTLKRAFTYARMELHRQALRDACEVVTRNPNCEQALKLGCTSALRSGEYQAAQKYVERLTTLFPSRNTYEELSQKVFQTLKQAAGEIDVGSIVRSITLGNLVTNVPTFIGDIEVRPSSIAGRGMFATKSIVQGQLLMCENPLAITHCASLSSFKDGLNLPLGCNDPFIDRKYMSLWQELASNAVRNPHLCFKMNRIFAGDDSHVDEDPRKFFDYNIHRAARVIKYNQFCTRPLPESSFHDLYDPTVKETAALRDSHSDTFPGLWRNGSMLNHSCLPNTIYCFIGDLMILHAIRAITANEEITISYIRTTEKYEDRKDSLRTLGVDCSCPLCIADATLEADTTLSEDVRTRRYCMPGIDMRMKEYAKSDRSSNDFIDVLKFQETTRKCLNVYDFDAMHNIPRLQMVGVLFHMGHIFLGDVDKWEAASPSTKSKAQDCFTACLEVGLGLRLIKDPKSSYCELAFVEHSQVVELGILALVALAELAFLSSQKLERGRTASLRLCAKQLYKLWYGEDATFDDRHHRYRCRKVSTAIGLPSPSSNWEDIKASAVAAPASIPKSLQCAS